MKTALYAKPNEIHTKLAELGLNEESLLLAVQRGYLASASCTANHPPLFPAIAVWAETVCALREQLFNLGWTRLDTGNYSRVIDGSGRIAIAVATGDEGTGREDGTPSTKAPKGPNTVEAITANLAQLDLFDSVNGDRTSDAAAANELQTWVLLMHRSEEEIRSELSLPFSMAPDGRINGWRERILLPATALDPIKDIAPPSLPDLDIDIKRRA